MSQTKSKNGPPVSPLYKQVHEAMKAWSKVEGTPENLLQQLILVQKERQSGLQTDSPPALRKATNEVLLKGLAVLAQKDSFGAELLRRRFLNQEMMYQLAQSYHESVDTLDRKQRKALNSLANILWEQEKALQDELVLNMENKLPSPNYDQLFGVEALYQKIVERLLSSQAPYIYAIAGMGGLGKTALADKITRHLIRSFQFSHLFYIRVETNSLNGNSLSPSHTFYQIICQIASLLPNIPAGLSPEKTQEQVRHRLKKNPCLVFIDNLEDEADTAYLFTQLPHFAQPSKFLITTRVQPMGQFNITSDILTELNQTDSMQLIRHEATHHPINLLQNVPDEQLRPIFQTVGGNPYALKLVVSLIKVMSLPAILEDLQKAHTNSTIEMYHHIYWKIWNTLKPTSRDLLETMVMISHTGATAQQIQKSAELNEAEFWQAVAELTACCLIEKRGSLWEPRYGIHRLTETFLQTHIIRQ